MATSGSVNFTVPGDEIIEAAYRIIGEVGTGMPMTANQLFKGRQALNMLIKQLQGPTTKYTGLKEWARKRVTIFLEKDQNTYVLGPAGDHATASYVQSTMSVAAAAAATTITPVSTTGMSNGDTIGITLDDDTVHWTTINGVPTSDVVLTTGLASGAAAGNRIVTYTTKINRPLRIISLILRNEEGTDLTLTDMVTIQHYDTIPDKDAMGTPTDYLYEIQLNHGNLYLNRAPEDSDDVLIATILRPLEDIDSANDDIDYPQEWMRPLKWQLSIDLAAENQQPVTEEMKLNRDEAMAIAASFTVEDEYMKFEPGRDE